MHKPNINNLSGAERQELARLIRQYATPEVVRRHWEAVNAGVHDSPTGFLSFHRNYIEGLEGYLTAQGHSNWVPLPVWNPVDPIPEEFNIPGTGLERLRNLNPGISFSPRFNLPNLVSFQTDADLGTALMPPHNRVHNRVGGVMNNLRRAPEAPIFWPWHSFIDDIWWTWQRQTVIVPDCIGMRLSRARTFLESVGLIVGRLTSVPSRRRTPWPPQDRLFVREQSPEPGVRATRGTAVNLGLSPT